MLALSAFPFRNVTTVFIYVTKTYYSPDILHFWSLHPEWYSYNLLVVFLLSEFTSIVIHLMNLAIEESNNWIVYYLELIIETQNPESFHR